MELIRRIGLANLSRRTPVSAQELRPPLPLSIWMITAGELSKCQGAPGCCHLRQAASPLTERYPESAEGLRRVRELLFGPDLMQDRWGRSARLCLGHGMPSAARARVCWPRKLLYKMLYGEEKERFFSL